MNRKKRKRPTGPLKITSIKDLIHVASHYRDDKCNWDMLEDLIPSLIELDSLIGMEKLKMDVIDMIIYHIQKFPKYTDELHHTVIYGPPGTGKTTVAKILAEIFCKLEIVSNGHIVKVKRENFIGKYLGYTEAQTKDIIEKCSGGVLLIDEAYSLGQTHNTDSYSKAVIDILNQYLSEKKDFVCIIIGYEEEIRNCFFSVNPGLESRFTRIFRLDQYTYSDLAELFLSRIKKDFWDTDMDMEYIKQFFKKNHKSFQYFGRDIDTLFGLCKNTHSKRLFCSGKGILSVLNSEDLEKAYSQFCLRNVSKKEDDKKYMMYI